MTARSRIVSCGILLLVLSGCQTLPTVKDFEKQEHIVQHSPPIHLAVRGCRMNRNLTLQVFLLTASNSLWLHSMALKLPDGTTLPPKSLNSLDPEPEKSPSVSIGFGIGFGGGGSRSHSRHEEIPSHESSSGTSSSGGVGVGIPIGLFGKNKKPPRSIEATYELPENQVDCEGSELTVTVATKPKKKQDTTATTKPATTDNTQPETVTVAFVLDETVPAALKEKDSDKNVDKEKVKDIVREINFTLKE